jgi:apolipoprotein N-acyltransferase
LHLILLALLSGALLALSFPKHVHPAFAWIALTPLVICAWQAASRRQAFLLGLLAGGVYFWGTLYWLIETMTTFGGLSTLTAVFAAFLLVAYLSLFPAVFSVTLAIVRRRTGVWALALAAPIWVTTELGRQYVWDGFPWALLGYSQVTVLPIAQIVSVVGVYGLSGLLAFVSAALAAPVLLSSRGRLIFHSRLRCSSAAVRCGERRGSRVPPCCRQERRSRWR